MPWLLNRFDALQNHFEWSRSETYFLDCLHNSMFFHSKKNVSRRGEWCKCFRATSTRGKARCMPVLIPLLHEYSSIKNTKQCRLVNNWTNYKSYWWIYGSYSLKLCDVDHFFLNLRMAGLYVSKLTSIVCVELGKILVICKKW